MKRSLVHCTAFAALMLATGATGAADKKPRSDVGAQLYTENCAICHGSTGKGNGIGVEFLSKQPADLTSLSKKNGGVFPFDRVVGVIDGRNEVVGHGNREMPIWGQRFSEDRIKAAEYYVDVPYDMEMYARNRILAITDYLNRIQAK